MSRSQPWMKFYPSDWRSDPALRVCSLAARGLWIECLCLMHEAEPYGHLTVNGKPATEVQIAMLTGTDPATVGQLLAELREAGALSLNKAGTVYSRRMVKDNQRRIDGEFSQKNGRMCKDSRRAKALEKKEKNPPPTQVVGEVVCKPPCHPEARSQILEEENPPSSPHGGNAAEVVEKPKKPKAGYPAEFEALWASYPSRGDAPNPKGAAYDACRKIVAAGTDWATLQAAVHGYAAYCRRTGKDGETIQQAATFFGPKKSTWQQYAAQPGGLLQGMTPAPLDFERWKNRADYHRKTGKWQPQWGPLPAEPGCQCPAELLELSTA